MVAEQPATCQPRNIILEPVVKRQLLERYLQMNAEGKLQSRPQLDQFYTTFRDRFSPDGSSRRPAKL